jgi:hypothetical protein
LKVKIIGRKLYLPKGLIERAGLPEDGECEATLVGDEVRLRRESVGPLAMTKLLKEKKPVLAHIDRMVLAQEVDDV